MSGSKAGQHSSLGKIREKGRGVCEGHTSYRGAPESDTDGKVFGRTMDYFRFGSQPSITDVLVSGLANSS